MVVELDVFSGRANPRWTVASGDFWIFLDSLGPGSAPEPPGLGYRGFVCRDGARWCRVFHDRVDGSSGPRADPLLEAERRLIATMPDEFRRLVG
ncbi:hypothetical protein ACIBG8_36370 [Nonomuraea sp. NPDC050556]|uniref:hypothetical protein n=1 Tax=Nonomuraea sp. NPDC050556 TaxID=3364369 RepID=UPI0037AF4FB1